MFLTGLPRVLDDAGVSWSLTDGAMDRSLYRQGITHVRAVIWHTTESQDSVFRGSKSKAPTLNYVIGTESKPYPSYNLLIGRGGHIHVVAAGAAAHAGKGITSRAPAIPRDQGNRYSFGISFDANNSKYPITVYQLEAAARLGAAINREWRNTIPHIMHGEWATPRGRRSDPTCIPGGWPAFRAAIRRGYWKTPDTTSPSKPTKQPAPKPAPTPAKKDWFTMATAAELRTIVRDEIDAALAEKTVTWTDSITKETRQVSLAQAMTYASIHWSRETDRDTEAVADSE